MVFMRHAYKTDLGFGKEMQFTQTDRLYAEAFLNSGFYPGGYPAWTLER